MKAPNKMKKIKHRSKGKYYTSGFSIKHYFRNYPLKMISKVFIDYDGKIVECWKLNKHKNIKFVGVGLSEK